MRLLGSGKSATPVEHHRHSPKAVCTYQKKKQQAVRSVAQFPVDCPKDEGDGNGEGEAGGVVGRGAPEGDVELLEDDEVLLPGGAGVLGCKVQGRYVRVRLALLLKHLLLLPAKMYM